MSKKKKILLIIIIILVLIGIIILNLNTDPKTETKYKSRVEKTCDQINADINKKNNFLVLFAFSDATEDSDLTIQDILENYQNTTIHIIKNNELEDKCVKEIFSKNDIYETIAETKIPTIVTYKEGKYSGAYAGLDSYKQTENYLAEQQIITKEEIKEEHTVEEYKENVNKKSEYIMLIIANEEKRREYETLLKKHFSEYNYDIVNLNSETGKQVQLTMEKTYGTINEYPRILYFKNSELIENWDAADEYDITFFKEKITKGN